MKLRVARHTSDLEQLINFYTTLFNLKVMGEFKDHAGYNGVFIGDKNAGWHLEFTTSDDKPNHFPDNDDLLVFYASSADEYESILQKIKINNIFEVSPKNPYWKENGITIIDPDGFRVVVAKAT